MPDSYCKQSLDAVHAAIVALGLAGIDSTKIKVRRKPWDSERPYEGITVHPLEELAWRGTNMREDIGYRLGVTMIQNNDMAINDATTMERILQWREAIRRYFVENSSLGAIAEMFNIKVEHGPVFKDDELKFDNYDISQLVLRVWIRETRT